MRYSINEGIEKSKSKVKRFIAASAATMMIAGAAGAPAFAAGNSTPGGARYDSNPGRQQATEVGAQCDSGAGSGAFGYLGKDNNPGDPSWDGGNGTDPGTTAQTGVNNSAVCGNRP